MKLLPRLLKNFDKNWKVYLFVIIFALSLFSVYLYITAGQKDWDKSLVLLSEQFLKRKISIPISSYLPIGDIADYKYNFYLYFGPFSSVFLMPFVSLFGKQTPQYLIGIFSIISSFIGIYLISRKFKFQKIDSLWLSLFFVFSTVLFSLAVMNISAFQAEVLGVPFVIFALYEYLSRKRSLFIGILLGIAVLTRFPLMLSFVFFFVEFLRKRLALKQLILIFIPIFISLTLLGLYNQRRFHSVFETGYNYNISLKSFPLRENLKYGSITIAHIPANLYSLLIMPPEPLKADKDGFFLKFPYLTANPWGMAIWYTSPLFLFLLFKFKKTKYTLSLLAAIIAISIPLFTYYSVGFIQFGYRYALDFMPFLFLLLLQSLYPKLTKTAIALIIIGVLFNLVYADSLFGIYPLLNIF